jgi:hypothetical protein
VTVPWQDRAELFTEMGIVEVGAAAPGSFTVREAAHSRFSLDARGNDRDFVATVSDSSEKSFGSWRGISTGPLWVTSLTSTPTLTSLIYSCDDMRPIKSGRKLDGDKNNCSGTKEGARPA